MIRLTTWPTPGPWYSIDPKDALEPPRRFCVRVDGDHVQFRSGEWSDPEWCAVDKWRYWAVTAGCRPTAAHLPFLIAGQVWRRRSTRTVTAVTIGKVRFFTSATPTIEQWAMERTFYQWAAAQNAMPLDDVMHAISGGPTQ